MQIMELFWRAFGFFWLNLAAWFGGWLLLEKSREKSRRKSASWDSRRLKDWAVATEGSWILPASKKAPMFLSARNPGFEVRTTSQEYLNDSFRRYLFFPFSSSSPQVSLFPFPSLPSHPPFPHPHLLSSKMSDKESIKSGELPTHILTSEEQAVAEKRIQENLAARRFDPNLAIEVVENGEFIIGVIDVTNFFAKVRDETSPDARASKLPWSLLSPDRLAINSFWLLFTAESALEKGDVKAGEWPREREWKPLVETSYSPLPPSLLYHSSYNNHRGCFRRLVGKWVALRRGQSGCVSV